MAEQVETAENVEAQWGIYLPAEMREELQALIAKQERRRVWEVLCETLEPIIDYYEWPKVVRAFEALEDSDA